MPIRSKDSVTSNFDAVALSVASPEQIMTWSFGEVTKPETINYRTQKPERDGLFCERIFGPTKNWECYCGKYKKIRYKNIVCDKCGVEVTRNSVRRERMGHIKLAVPVVHIWFLRSTPSRIGLLLDMPVKELERVVYFANYIIKDVNEDARKNAINELEADYKNFKKKIQDEHVSERNELELQKKNGEKITETDFSKLASMYEDKVDELTSQYEEAKNGLLSLVKHQTLSELQYRDFSMKFGHVFSAGIGAEAIRDVIAKIDLAKMIEELKLQIKSAIGQKRTKIIRRIMLAGSLLKANIQPEWMVLTILPVIPPDLRPMVQLDGGRFATSDLNDLYRRVINRNNRLKRLLEMGAPEVICRNEKRMLQEAVDALLHNSSRQGKAITKTGSSNLQLKSLSDILKGKQGRFRQNLLGKRVDYSGRSVIVVGPNLRLDECGIPKKMALELFKPFVLGKLIRDGLAHNIKNAEKLIAWNRSEIWDALEAVTKDHFVILNRAPTLHRLGIQAFKPVLIEGKAIQLHPLVCSAFNADFDGDQMAVHVPLSKMAQWEAANIMNSAKNLLKPSSGNPIVNPSLDIVLGCYYLTKLDERLDMHTQPFADETEVLLACNMGMIKLRQPIKARLHGGIIDTTAGRVIFNQIVPQAIGYYNNTLSSKELSALLSEVYEKTDIETTADFADNIKALGFKYVTYSGISIAVSDLTTPSAKPALIQESDKKVEMLNKQYRLGLMTDMERYVHVLRVWEGCKSKLQSMMMDELDKHGPIFQMIDSGARGNLGQLTQMAGMKGLVTNPAGKIIELPIKGNFREGVSMLEYFIAQHGGRKGRSDTALKTASAGYLTRRLVDAVQDVMVREPDCGTSDFIILEAIESEKIGEKFESRIFGRTLAQDITLASGDVIPAHSVLDRAYVKSIIDEGINTLPIRSVICCETLNGICQKCYGRDLGTNELVKAGTTVGIVAAQSIGEPGTQLTMRTFHMGGVVEGKDITQGLPRVEELFEARNPKFRAPISEISGKVSLERVNNHMIVHVLSEDVEIDTYRLLEDFTPTVMVGDEIKAKQIVAKRSEGKGTLKSKAAGMVYSISDEEIVVHHLDKASREYKVSLQDSLLVKDGDSIAAGDPLIEGHLNLQELADVTSVTEAQRYIIREVQSIYAAQGQTINDKHIEIIGRHMFSKCRVLESGDSDFLPGQTVDFYEVSKVNVDLIEAGKKKVVFERMLLGLTRLSLATDSWLSAASFQETIRVLVEAATTKKIDGLKGLKENVIIGKLIPAGTNYERDLRDEVFRDDEKEIYVPL